MKTLLQQLKPTLPLYRRAPMLLLLFSITFTFKAQSFYFVNGTQITIDENTTLFVTDSGKVNQTGLTDFEGQIITQKLTLNATKQVAFNDKKSRLLSTKYKKDSRSKSIKEKAKNYAEVEPIELIKIYPDNFFSPNQKGIGISGSIPLQYNLKFIIENIRFKSIHRYSIDTNNEIINGDLLFLKDHHLSLRMTRPPPSEFYFKKHTLNI